MIPPQDDDGIFSLSAGFQGFENFSNLGIHITDRGEIAVAQFPCIVITEFPTG